MPYCTVPVDQHDGATFFRKAEGSEGFAFPVHQDPDPFLPETVFHTPLQKKRNPPRVGDADDCYPVAVPLSKPAAALTVPLRAVPVARQEDDDASRILRQAEFLVVLIEE